MELVPPSSSCNHGYHTFPILPAFTPGMESVSGRILSCLVAERSLPLSPTERGVHLSPTRWTPVPRCLSTMLPQSFRHWGHHCAAEDLVSSLLQAFVCCRLIFSVEISLSSPLCNHGTGYHGGKSQAACILSSGFVTSDKSVRPAGPQLTHLQYGPVRFLPL